MKSFYEMLNILEQKKNQIAILERIFFDIQLITEQEDEDDDGPVELPDPFAGGSEDAAPSWVADDIHDDEEEEEVAPKRKRTKKALGRNTRDSMLNVRYKAMHERKKLVDKLKQTQDTKILEELGYDPTKPGAFQIASAETGNDIPVSRVEFIESQTMESLRKEFLENLYNLYTFYGNDERKMDRLSAEVLERVVQSLTIRRVSKDNQVQDWTNPAPLVDESTAAISKYINAIIKNMQLDVKRRDKKVSTIGAYDSEDSYKDVVKNVAAPDAAQSEEELERREKQLEVLNKGIRRLETVDKKIGLTFLLLYGQDSVAEEFFRTGKIVLAPDAEWSMVMKILGSGQASKTSADYDLIKEKLLNKFNITASNTQISSYRNRAMEYLRGEIND